MKTILTLIIAFAVHAAYSQTTLEVVVTKVKDATGNIRVGIFKDEDTFLKTALFGEVVKAQKDQVTIVFKNIPPGTYGVSVIHDENENGELDSGTFGIPKEGFGFGNDAMGTFGPPGFKKASITVEPGKKVDQHRIAVFINKISILLCTTNTMNRYTMKRTIAIAILLIALTPLVADAQKTATAPVVNGENIAVVQTNSGKVRGYIHNGIFTYKGIPYAQAKRFQAPQKPAPWEGVRSSMTYGPVSPLMNPTTSVFDEVEFVFDHNWGYPNEDCLRVNVWTPGINDGKKRPVMFWIHGGGYTAGSSQELPSYDGEAIAKKGDVVLVSVNHRLNVLGFLDLSEYGSQYKGGANASFLDLVMALQWVKDNASNFGGDPNNVTIFGQSGGGGKVSTLMSSPQAKGLFHKAIVQSGVWADFQDQAVTKRIGQAVLNELGLVPSAVDSIQKVPYEKLAAAGNKALQKVRQQLTAEGKLSDAIGIRVGWAPTIDGSFLTHNMKDPQALALGANIPFMIGSTKNEFMNSLRDPKLRNADAAYVKEFLTKQWGDKTDSYIAAVKKAYPADTKPNDLADIDQFFRPGTVSQANARSAAGNPTFVYLFTWQSPVMDGVFKSIHCIEIPFAMNNIARSEQMTGGGKEAQALADKMSTAWINFAKTGNPNHKGLPVWPKYTEAVGATMMFDNVSAIRNHPDKEILDLTMAQTPRF